MTRRSQRLTQNSLPFRHDGDGLNFHVDRYRVDGDEWQEAGLSAHRRTLNVADLPEWERLDLSVKLELNLETVEHVFPEVERNDPPGRLYVAVHCHDTIYRDRTIVADGSTPAKVYGGDSEVTLSVKRSMVRGEVEFHPHLVRASEREADDRYADTRIARLAGGDPFYVAVDDSAVDEPGLIDGEEAPFSSTDHLPGEDQLYYLDFRNDQRPKLWLNADHPRVTEVLAAEGSVGTEARLRDVVLDEVQYGVWTQLLLRAAAAVNADGETEYDWQETVVESFAPEMYELNDPTEAALRLREEARDIDTLGRLAGRVDAEVQSYVDPQTQIVKLLEEGLDV